MIWYGGDYNPEQWPEQVWNDDVRLMREGGITIVSLGIFSWAKLEPREGEFDFGWLDRIIDKLHDGSIRVDLATATASPPPWLTHTYPEVLPVTENGVRLAVGSRQQYCPSSPIYREKAALLAGKIVERYAQHPAIEMWHINNEYGCHVSHCYCDVSAEAFRRWLEAKYGSIKLLNEAWGTAFWSQQYQQFAEIYPPSAAPSFRNPGQLLDFDRFSSDELLDCFRTEVAVVRGGSNLPLTTNFMGFFKGADYWKWAKEVDIVSDDTYPDPADPDSVAYAAMVRDLMRSLGGGDPWLLMEQAPSAVNWRTRNAPKRAGQMRAWSYQSIARGADGILFFQWRQSMAGSEKFHSGMVPHAGEDSRVWREISAFGNELAELEAFTDARVDARVAIVFEWDSWWSLEQAATPAQMSYVRSVFAWYRELFRRAIIVDFVQADADLSGYDLVVAPTLFLASAAAIGNLDAYAQAGGTLLVTYQSAIIDEVSRITEGGYLGALQSTLGIRVEEFAPFAGPDLAVTGAAAAPVGAITGELTGDADAHVWAEFVNDRGAEVLARFVGGVVDGWPAITRNAAGSGVAWYSATQPGDAGITALVGRVLEDAGVTGAVDSPLPGVEYVRRGNVLVVINHTENPVTLEDGTVVEPQGVALLS